MRWTRTQALVGICVFSLCVIGMYLLVLESCVGSTFYTHKLILMLQHAIPSTMGINQSILLLNIVYFNLTACMNPRSGLGRKKYIRMNYVQTI